MLSNYLHSSYIASGIISNLEMIKVYGRMCVGYMEILCHFLWGTWASADFGISRGPRTNPLGILRNDCKLISSLCCKLIYVSSTEKLSCRWKYLKGISHTTEITVRVMTRIPKIKCHSVLYLLTYALISLPIEVPSSIF